MRDQRKQKRAEYLANTLALKIRVTARRDRIKAEAMAKYGPNGEAKCHKCSITDIRVLCLDHINNDGKQTRTHSGSRFYLILRKKGWPPGLQTLCANCNLIKEIERKKVARGY